MKKNPDNGIGAWVWIIIIFALIILVLGIIIFRKYKLKNADNVGNDYKNMKGQTISMEDEIGIN